MNNSTLTDTLTWRDFLIRAALVIVSVIVIVLALPRDNGVNFKIEQGKPWRYADFTAPFDFPIYKSEEVVQRERDSILKQYEPYYTLDKDKGYKAVRQFTKNYSEGIPDVPDENVSVIVSRLRAFYAKGIMDSNDYNKLSRDTSSMIRLVDGKHATPLPPTSNSSPTPCWRATTSS